MPTSFEVTRLLKDPLESVLLQLYGAPFLRWLYDVALREMSARPPAGARSAKAAKVPTKPVIVETLMRTLRDQEAGRRLLAALPKPSQVGIAAVTWVRHVDLATLEKELGMTIAVPNPDLHRRAWDPFVAGPEHGFLLIIPASRSRWSFSGTSGGPLKSDYHVVMPDAVREIFKTIVPAPPDYELQPLDDAPAAERRYSCAPSILADLRLVSEYIAQGHLRYTKAETPSTVSIRTVHKMAGGTEFFENLSDPDFALLRTRLLTVGTAFVGEKVRERFLAATDTAEPVRRLFEAFSASASFLHEELLPHFSLARNRWCRYDVAAPKRLAGFYADFPSDKWVSWENIRHHHLLRDAVPCLFDRNAGYLQANAQTSGDTWSRSIGLSDDNAFELVSEPLLKGYAFLLAAFGLAEIAYSAPTHPKYRRTGAAYLTPFDGLRAVRLTPLGEYVLGKRITFELAEAGPVRSTLVLDETRLLVTCWNPDKLTELALAQLMESPACGQYRMTHKSLLGGCVGREDIEERLRLFRRVVSAKPPAVWERFFQQTLARIDPVQREPDYLVLKITDDEELRHLFSSDAVLREIVLKVEGLRIAVRQGDLKKLGRRLEQFGYLVPLDRLA